MSLLALQREFAAWLCAGTPAIARHGAGDPLPGLQVYRHAYHAQLQACLREAYPKTLAWLGGDAFERAAEAHIRARPPQAWSLDHYGEDFGASVALAYLEDPEVGELAWLDWQLRRAFDGADAAGPDPSAVPAEAWEHARFRFVPTLRWRLFHSNAASIWRALAEQRPPPAACLLAEPVAVRVWRQGWRPSFVSMSAAEARALALAEAGHSFGAICLALSGDGQDAAALAAGMVLRDWLAQGVLGAIDLAADSPARP